MHNRPNRCYILTGASRGLGLGIARAIAAQGDHLIALARQETPELAQLGAALPGYRFVAVDLANIDQVSEIAEELLGSLAAMDWQGIYLINNAGVVEPIGPAGSYGDAEMARCLTVNLTAAIQFSNAFLRHLRDRACDKRILQISSGAGRNAYTGWSAYCASKAGLDMYSRCVGLEQDGLPHPVRIASLAPGIIDTGMQASIRATPEGDFPLLEQFRQYHANGELADPNSRGRAIVQLLHTDHIGHGAVLNIRDFI
ncbi:SDR family NAD(P)-dependent oxidoreductase [Chitinimonas viridis]|uniref:SDR family NAD(P)-dependent oxidoreductase n=1 Tax=Chitinimonas viridis TaxID=664880 RepID=A0ABT8B353_9NEIS|nr:SDR family NAD(P)-dependent oxidoreductase [Chitinimonas viridis]MDN3576086.1 SDR family NAD(P)-dependent oxidoreductase [Chitinimonas viridis]